MKIDISPTAGRQIAEFKEWWNVNRSSARVRVENAVEEALEAILAHPELGPRYAKAPQYRTWRLRGTPYVLFYRVDEAADTIWVAVAWSAKRGVGPDLA
jgi:plasmid stabilization system protein ParE